MEKVKNPFAVSYFSFIKTSGLIELRVKEALKPFGITHSQLNVLSVLVQNYPNPVSSKDIKNKLIISVSPDITRLLDRLVNKGLVERYTCPGNRRKIDIKITEQGIEFSKKAQIAAKQSVNNFFEDDLTKDEAEVLGKILKKIKL